MNLQKLSSNVNEKANRSIRRIITGLCLLMGLVILVIVLVYTVKDNSKQVQVYSSQVDNTMAQKVSFINTVAAGVTSGTVKNDYYSYVDTMAAQYNDVSAVYVCLKEPGVIYSDGIMTYMSGGWVPEADFVVSERDWYTGAIESDDVYISEPYVDEQTGNICITLSRAIYKNGTLAGVAGMDMYMDDLVTLIENSYEGGNYVFLVSGAGTILTHPDEEIALNNKGGMTVEEALHGKYESVCKDQLSTKLIFDYKGGFKFAISSTAPSCGWNVVAVISLTWVIVIIALIAVLDLLLGIVLGRVAKQRLTEGVTPMFAPLEDLAANVSRISDGDLNYHFQVDDHSEEVHSLSVALNDTMQGLQHYIAEITNTVTSISEKNLDFDVNGDYAGDYEKIKEALLEILRVLNGSFSEINERASAVMQYAGDLSATSEDVARVATIQSESVVDASREMKTLTDNMEKISEFAASIKKNTDNVNQQLALGNGEMDKLVSAMDEIAKCYDEIAGFVTEINEIASQTNLLALNASIEAARAGDVGKGFAVVATEIGTLSANSSQSSVKISDAIARSLRSVAAGKELVAKADKTIADSVEYSASNSQMVNEIVSFVETQKNSANEISASLKKISEMVENNAASAEENSAISQCLGDCAKSLMDTISQFKLKKS